MPACRVLFTQAAERLLGYAAGWGALYGLVQERRPVSPVVGGPVMGSVIYGLAFSRAGAATQTGSEPHP